MSTTYQKAVAGWRLRPLGSLGKVISGATPSTRIPEFWDGSIVWITPADLSGQRTPFINASQRRITRKGLDTCAAQLVPKHNLVISSRAPIGYIAIPTVDFATNQGCKSLWLDEQQDCLFHYYNLSFHVQRLKEKGEGTTFAEISKTTLSTVELPVPDSKQVQSKIGEILATVDQAIEQTEALITKYERIKTGLMQDLLTRGIDEHGCLRAAAGVAPHLYQNSLLGKVPKGWVVKHIDNIAEVTKLAGYEFTKFFTYTGEGDVIALRALNIKNESLDLTDIQRISRIVSDQLPRSKVREGDVLITYIGAYIGDVLLISESDKFHLAPNVAKITTSGMISPAYLERVLRGNSVRQQIGALTAITATPSLTMTQIRKILVALPISKAEQEAIVCTMAVHDRCIRVERDRLRKLVAVKVGLMQDLLTAKVPVEPLLKLQTAK